MCLEFRTLGPDSKQHYKVGESYRCSKAVKFTHTQAPRPANFKPSQQLGCSSRLPFTPKLGLLVLRINIQLLYHRPVGVSVL